MNQLKRIPVYLDTDRVGMAHLLAKMPCPDPGCISLDLTPDKQYVLCAVKLSRRAERRVFAAWRATLPASWTLHTPRRQLWRVVGPRHKTLVGITLKDCRSLQLTAIWVHPQFPNFATYIMQPLASAPTLAELLAMPP